METVLILLACIVAYYYLDRAVAAGPRRVRLDLVQQAAQQVCLEITLMRTRFLGKAIAPQLGSLMDELWEKYSPLDLKVTGDEWPETESFLRTASQDLESMLLLERTLYPEHSLIRSKSATPFSAPTNPCSSTPSHTDEEKI